MSDPDREYLRVYSTPAMKSELTDLHCRLAPHARADRPGPTIEMLLRAALQLINDPSPHPKLPADLVKIRKALGVETKDVPEDPAKVAREVLALANSQGELAERLLRLLKAAK